MIQLQPLPRPSKNIMATGYDEDARELVVQFNSGKAYLYRGVEPAVVQGLLEADSAGSYLYRNIRDSYEYQPLAADQYIPPDDQTDPNA